MKPWEYRVSVVIPHLSKDLEMFRLVVDLLRLQTVKPFIMVIDTGSPMETWHALEQWANDSPDLEAHRISAKAWNVPCESVCAAQDLAQSACRTPYLFCSHTDVFPRRRDLLEWLLRQCGPAHPVVGYAMSPREWATDEWEWMVGHSCLMLHMPTIHRAGVTWSMQRTHHAFDYRFEEAMGWPDTETGFSHCLAAAGIVPKILGQEINGARLVDENHDHPRNVTCHQREGSDFPRPDELAAAIREAKERVASWSASLPTFVPTSAPSSSPLLRPHFTPASGPCSCSESGHCDRKGRLMVPSLWEKCKVDQGFCDMLDRLAVDPQVGLPPPAGGVDLTSLESCCPKFIP